MSGRQTFHTGDLMPLNLLRFTCLSLLVLAALDARAETLIRHRRIGNNMEAATYDPSGPNKDKAIAIDGNDVFAIALKGTGVKKLFDVTALDPSARTPRGIVW